MKFAKHTFLGHSGGKSKMISGTKLLDGPPKATPSPADKPMSWRECPPDARKLNWQQVGTYFRTRYRRGWLIDKGSTYQYVPDAANDKPSSSFGATAKKPNDRQSASDAKRQRAEGGFLHKTNSGGIAFVPDAN